MGFYDILEDNSGLYPFRNQLAYILEQIFGTNDQFWADLACHAHYVPYEWYQVMGHYCVLHLACCESESAVEHEQYLRMISPHGRG